MSLKIRGGCMGKKVIKGFGYMLLTIIVCFGIKTTYEFVHSPYNEAMKNPERLTIFYKPNCRRCRKVALHVLPKIFFSTKRDYLIDSRKLNEEQHQEAKLSLNPGFRYHNRTVQTINTDKIDEIWSQSH